MSLNPNKKRDQNFRMQLALKELYKRGIIPESNDDTKIVFIWKDETIMFFPYTGWHTGKSIKDGRGLMELLNQLK